VESHERIAGHQPRSRYRVQRPDYVSCFEYLRTHDHTPCHYRRSRKSGISRSYRDIHPDVDCNVLFNHDRPAVPVYTTADKTDRPGIARLHRWADGYYRSRRKLFPLPPTRGTAATVEPYQQSYYCLPHCRVPGTGTYSEGETLRDFCRRSKTRIYHLGENHTLPRGHARGHRCISRLGCTRPHHQR